jgi:Flp pilus assembly protein TadD
MTRSQRVSLFWGTVALAFVLRMIHLLAMSKSPLFFHPIAAELANDILARGLIDGSVENAAPLTIPFLYPYLLAGLYAIFDSQRFPAQTIHALISALGVGWAALASAGVWGRRAGWSTGILLASLWTSIYFATELQAVTISLTLAMLALSLLLNRDDPLSLWAVTGAGVALGCAILMGQVLLAVLPALVWYVWPRARSLTFRQGLLPLVVGIMIPLAPVMVHSLVHGHQVVSIFTMDGVVDAGKQLRQVLGAEERSTDQFIYAWRVWSPIMRQPWLPGWPLVLALAILGFSQPSRQRYAREMIVGATVISLMALSVSHVHAASRLPAMAFLTLPAGAGVSLLISTWKERRWVHSKWYVVASFLVFTLSLMDLIGSGERRASAAPGYSLQLGQAWNAHGQTDLASEAYLRAFTNLQSNALTYSGAMIDDLHHDYASLLVDQGQLVEAIKVIQHWVQYDQAPAAARLWLGNLLLEMQRIDEASAQFDFVLRAQPTNDGARLGQAWILYHNGQPGIALRRFQQQKRLNKSLEAGYGAGLCLMALQREAEAENTWRAVLGIDANYGIVWEKLAGLYTATGRDDQAREAREILTGMTPAADSARQRLRYQEPGR